MKKIIIIIIAIVAIIIGAVCLYNHYHRFVLVNDGTAGTATFERVREEAGFGIDIDRGEFPLEIKMAAGTLNIKIGNENGTIFEETDITESKTETINIPEDGYYYVTLWGDKATGTLKYPVAESQNTPGFVEELDKEVEAQTNADKETASNVLETYLKSNDEYIEEVRIDSMKVYSREEIANDPLLTSYEIGEKDIVFTAEYSLKISDECEDKMPYTAATGEIDGEWVINKYNVGIAKYDAEKDSYELTNFGTGF